MCVEDRAIYLVEGMQDRKYLNEFGQSYCWNQHKKPTIVWSPPKTGVSL